MKKHWLCLLLAAFLGSGLCVQAQEMGDDEDVAERQERAEKMAKQMARQLKLDDATKDWFVPLYVEYNDSLRSARGEMPKAKEVDDLTEEEATAALEGMFAATERTVAVKLNFYARFKEKLTAQQVLRVFMPAQRKRTSNTNSRRGPGGGPGGFPGGGPGMGGGF